MKKCYNLFITLIILFPLCVLANVSQTEKLNQRLKEILSIFNNASTKTFFVVNELDLTPERVSSVKGKVLYTKKGKVDTVILNVSGSYENKDHKNPKISLKALAKVNILKLLGGEEAVNEAAHRIEAQFKEVVEDQMDEFGDAINVNAQITKKETDRSGNIIQLEGEGSIHVDLSKLSQDNIRENVLWTDIQFKIAFDLLNNQIQLEVSIVSNSSYKGFEKDQQGLKEWIEGLINQNEEQEETIVSFFSQLDKFAKSTIEER